MTEKHICIFCNYSTTIKCNYKKHLNTKKHKKNYNNDPKISLMSDQSKSKVSQKSVKSQSKVSQLLQCKNCKFIYKHKQSLWNHKKRNNCKSIKSIINKTINNTNNITNNINTNNITNNNIILNFNSIEYTKKIKDILLKMNHDKLSDSNKRGEISQAEEIFDKLQDFLIKIKKENQELQNFQKTNRHDNLIDIYKENRFQITFFDEYNRDDLLKISKILSEICNEETKGNILYYICRALREYDYFGSLSFEDNHGIDIVLRAIDKCCKRSKLEHYNLTKEIDTKA